MNANMHPIVFRPFFPAWGYCFSGLKRSRPGSAYPDSDTPNPAGDTPGEHEKFLDRG